MGGHIGYGVVASQRRRGYGTEMLRHAISVSASLGIENLPVTCDEDNIGSIKAIENCGDIFDGFMRNSELEPRKRRYWINIHG